MLPFSQKIMQSNIGHQQKVGAIARLLFIHINLKSNYHVIYLESTSDGRWHKFLGTFHCCFLIKSDHENRCFRDKTPPFVRVISPLTVLHNDHNCTALENVCWDSWHKFLGALCIPFITKLSLKKSCIAEDVRKFSKSEVQKSSLSNLLFQHRLLNFFSNMISLETTSV